MKRIFMIAVQVLFIGILILSCQKDEQIKYNDQLYSVDYDKAKLFAIEYFNNQNRNDSISNRNNNLGESITFNKSNNLPGLHIFNFDYGELKSFIIISGDNRISPILAHGNESFPLDYIPLGVSDWMNKQILFIESLSTDNITQTNVIEETWQGLALPNEGEEGCCEGCPNYPECLDHPLIGCGANSDFLCDGVSVSNPCGNNNYFQYGPLLDTKWGQGCVYNELMPEEPILLQSPTGGACMDGLPCDHFYSGCVATAAAQVINYYEHPNSYPYTLFLPQYFPWSFEEPGADEIGELMFDIAESVDMEFGCYGSGAYTEDVKEALENNFDYSDGGDYVDVDNNEQIKQNIRWNKPVILDGCKDGILFNWIYSGCHAWVCDGYKGYSNQCYGYMYLHMNWGWNGSYNGWYNASNWAPGSYNYQYDKNALLNINP